MPTKQFSAILEAGAKVEPMTNEVVIDTINEDYQKLNDKIDKVISKIKIRKDKKKK